MALLMVYLALAAQFESFRHPFTVMLTVPLALFGALASLYLLGHTLNLFSQIGLIMLIGLVTKNGILIVEFANQRREQGLGVRDAVLDAAASRFRPIIMTTLTTTLGILPIALGLGGAAQSRVPMGVAVVGGLLFSLVLTLYLIPALYSYLAGAAPAVHSEEDAEGSGAKPDRPAKGLVTAGFSAMLILAGATILGSAHLAQARATQAQSQSQMNTTSWPLKLETALARAQERHPTVLAEKQALRRAEADATWGTTGLWPKVEASTSANRSWLDSRQQRAGVEGETSRDGAQTTNYAAGVNGTWTVFEGLKSPAQKQRLDLQAELAALRLAEVMLEVRQLTADAYFSVLRDRELWLAADTLTQLTGERFKLVKARRASGSVSRQEELEAEADAVAQEATKKRAEASLLASLAHLAQWVGFDAEAGLQANMALAFENPGDPPLREASGMQQALRDSSLDLRRANLAEKIAASGFKESLAELWPKVSLTAGYNYALTRAEQGVLTFNETTGPAVGAQLRWNLFDGGSLARDLKKAKALERETGYRSAATLTRVQSEWQRATVQAKGCLEALELERRNRALAAEAARLMQERLRAGAVSQVEAHLSEERYISGVQRSVGQLYECRQRELQLIRLVGH
jgi:multidrug efflux pump